MVRTTTSETVLIFPLIQLNHVGKMDNIPNHLIYSFNSTWGFCILSRWRIGLFFLFCLYAWVFFTFVTFYCSRLSSKAQLPFNLLEGNKFPDIWEPVTFNPWVVVVFESRGSLDPAHLSNIWASSSRWEYLMGCSPSTLWANIQWYLEFRPS